MDGDVLAWACRCVQESFGTPVLALCALGVSVTKTLRRTCWAMLLVLLMMMSTQCLRGIHVLSERFFLVG